MAFERLLMVLVLPTVILLIMAEVLPSALVITAVIVGAIYDCPWEAIDVADC